MIFLDIIIHSEHFKTRAAHFPEKPDERTGVQRATLGKRGSKTAVTWSDSKSIFQQQFGENHGDNGCYSINIFWQRHNPLDLRITVRSLKWPYLGLLGIILRERAGTDKMDYRMFRIKYLFACLGKLGEFSKQQQIIKNNMTITFFT